MQHFSKYLGNNIHLHYFSPYIPMQHCTWQHKWEEGRNVCSEELLECSTWTLTWASHYIGSKISTAYVVPHEG